MARGSSQRKSFMHNSMILMISLLFVKISGLMFKLPIVSIIGESGYGYFTSAYSIYLPVFILALSGFPAAVSRYVTAEYSKRNFINVRRIKKVSLVFFTVLGLAGTFLLALGADFLSGAVNNPQSALAVTVLAPTVFFCCVMSVYRGYYSGLSNLTPSAVSQVIEALGKLVIGVGATYALMNYGLKSFEESGMIFGTALQDKDAAIAFLAPYGAAAAILGVSVGSMLACGYIIIKYKISGDEITKEQLNSAEQSVLPQKTIFKRILRVGLPISLGAAVMQLCALIDNFTVLNILGKTVPENESLIREMFSFDSQVLSDKIPNILWGCLGVAMIFYNLIPLFVQSFSQSAIPDITEAYVKGDKDVINGKIYVTMKMSLLFAVPAGIGIMAVAEPLVAIFDSGITNASVLILRVICIAGIFSALCQPVNSILQSIGKYDTPVKVMVVAAIIKLISNILLINIPSINILGAACGSIISYGFLFIVLFALLVRFTDFRINLFKLFLPPVISASACGITAYLAVKLTRDTLGNTWSLLISVLLGAIIYFIFAFLTSAITKNEIFLLPGGKNLAKVLEKLHIIR